MVRSRDAKRVKGLVRRWHRVLPHSPAGFRLAYVAEDLSGKALAVAIWGRPVARREDQATTLELTRLAHGPRVPRNFGSWFLAQQRRLIRETLPQIVRLISYQDADEHDGALYRADNWRQVYGPTEKGHSWGNRPGRRRAERRRKVKWEREVF